MVELNTPRRRLALATLLVACIGPAMSVAQAQLDAGLNAGLEIEHDGETRRYNVYVPPGLDPDSPSPLLVDMHGSGIEPEEQRQFSGTDELADDEGIIVIYPEGVLNSWNAIPGASGTDDVGFIRATVETVSQQLAVDAERVYATGHSRGGGMAQRLACEASDMFAAFAPVASAVRPESVSACNPARPVPVLTFRGLDDGIVPFEGGTVGLPPGFITLSAAGALNHWSNVSQCTGTIPDTTIDHGARTSCGFATACADGVEVGMCAVAGGSDEFDHFIYDNDEDFEVTAAAWDFMSGFTLPADASPSPPIDTRVNHAWNNPDQSGEGILLDYGPSLDLLFGAWFTSTLEPVEPPETPQGIGGPGQRWLTMLLEVDGNVATGTLQARQGGAFGSPETDVEINPTVGEITIELLACDLAQVDYTIDSAGISGSFDMEPLEKTVNPDGFTCQGEGGDE